MSKQMWMNQHINLLYIIEYKEIEETCSNEELRKNYVVSQSKLAVC